MQALKSPSMEWWVCAPRVRRLQAIGSEVQSNEIRVLRLMLRLEVKVGTAGGGHRWITRRRHQSSVSYPHTWGGAAMELFRAEKIATAEDQSGQTCRFCWEKLTFVGTMVKSDSGAVVKYI